MKKILVLLLIGIFPLFFSGKVYAVDDYPYKNSVKNSADQWGFAVRNCTSYAAWKVNRDAVSTGAPYYFYNSMTGIPFVNFGDAGNWDNIAPLAGFSVDTHPQAGDVAVWEAGSGGAGDAGHVAYVESVNQDGSVNISEYNWNWGDGKYNERPYQRADKYIHFKKYAKSPYIVMANVPGDIYIRSKLEDPVNTFIGHSLHKVQTVGTRIGKLTADGSFYVQESLTSTPILESTSIKDFQLEGNRIGFLYTNGTFKIREGVSGPVTTISDNIKSFQLNGNWIAFQRSTDNMLMMKNGKDGNLYSFGTTYKDYQVNSSRIAMRNASNKVTIFDTLTGTSYGSTTTIAQYQLLGDRYGFLTPDGIFYIRQGLAGPTTEESGGIKKFQLEGNTVGFLYTNGTFRVREGISGAVVTESEGIKDFKISGDMISFLYPSGVFKGRHGFSGAVTTMAYNIIYMNY